MFMNYGRFLFNIEYPVYRDCPEATNEAKHRAQTKALLCALFLILLLVLAIVSAVHGYAAGLLAAAAGCVAWYYFIKSYNQETDRRIAELLSRKKEES